MERYAYLYSGNNVKIWGLTPRERMEKVLKKMGDIKIVDSIASIPSKSKVLILNCRHILDERIIQIINENSNMAVISKENGDDVIGCYVESELLNDVEKVIKKEISIYNVNRLKICESGEITQLSFQKKLRKLGKPVILDTEKNDINYIENKLYYGSYKGVTDIVTRLIWPKPAKLAVRFCVKCKITPNMVTTVSLILAILAGLLFYINQYVIALILAWFMTFLDTVDGKLARVTLSSSEFGHRLDHGIDILHPLYWYACWAYGLNAWNISFFSLNQTVGYIFIFYILGRLCEGFFQLILKAPFSIFCWRPIDTFFRLIAARRNPNLVILTTCAAIGAYDTGIFIVALWTIISTIVLITRIFMAFKTKKKKGQLTTWLADIDPERANKKRIYRLFIYN